MSSLDVEVVAHDGGSETRQPRLERRKFGGRSFGRRPGQSFVAHTQGQRREVAYR